MSLPAGQPPSEEAHEFVTWRSCWITNFNFGEDTLQAHQAEICLNDLLTICGTIVVNQKIMLPQIKWMLIIVWTEILSLAPDVQGPFLGIDNTRLEIVRQS